MLPQLQITRKFFIKGDERAARNDQFNNKQPTMKRIRRMIDSQRKSKFLVEINLLKCSRCSRCSRRSEGFPQKNFLRDFFPTVREKKKNQLYYCYI